MLQKINVKAIRANLQRPIKKHTGITGGNGQELGQISLIFIIITDKNLEFLHESSLKSGLGSDSLIEIRQFDIPHSRRKRSSESDHKNSDSS